MDIQDIFRIYKSHQTKNNIIYRIYIHPTRSHAQPWYHPISLFRYVRTKYFLKGHSNLTLIPFERALFKFKEGQLFSKFFCLELIAVFRTDFHSAQEYQLDVKKRKKIENWKLRGALGPVGRKIKENCPFSPTHPPPQDPLCQIYIFVEKCFLFNEDSRQSSFNQWFCCLTLNGDIII